MADCASEPTRPAPPNAAGAIYRAFTAHTGSGGMAGPALTARYALAVAVENDGADRREQAERMRGWARVLMTAADVMEQSHAE